jgi:glycosyltransferase involved in cell wall biosynthesis
MSNNRIAVVIPVFNEQSRSSGQYLESLTDIAWDIILVNDGSTDFSLEMLREIESTHLNVRVLNSPHNQGKAEAIRAGFKSLLDSLSIYDYVGFLDADGAISKLDSERIIHLADLKIRTEGFDCIWSSRVGLSGRDIQRTMFRFYVGRLIRTIIGFRHRNLPYDTQSGFKVFKFSKELKLTLEKKFETRWFADVELLLRLEASGKNYRIWEEPLNLWQEIGQSSLKFRKFPLIFIEIVRVLKIKPAQLPN